ncbi:MAG TPA: V-type ATP synthase subunit E family protein [Myxococcaceae bacterium]|nr:V-type ATP synthase subunit E family protein [Myxococcaceae bacterium]
MPDLLEALGRSNEEEVAGLLSAARSEAETIRAAARADADARLGHTLESERTRLRQAAQRRRVAARREAAARLLRARAVLLDRIFETARARASGVLGWPEYARALEGSVGQVRQLLGDDPGTLRCAPADAGRVQAWVAGSALSVVPAPEVPAGLHCTADGGRLTVDLTLPVRLARERPALAIALGPALEAAG